MKPNQDVTLTERLIGYSILALVLIALIGTFIFGEFDITDETESGYW